VSLISNLAGKDSSSRPKSELRLCLNNKSACEALAEVSLVADGRKPAGPSLSRKDILPGKERTPVDFNHKLGLT